MEPITTAAIAAALGAGLAQVGNKLIEKGIVEPALEPATEQLKKFVLSRPEQARQAAQADQALLQAVETALQAIDAPTEEADKFETFARNMGLIRLTAAKTPALRRQLAQAVLGFTDPTAAPPEELVIALGWPRSQLDQLSQLLAALRAQLYSLEAWRPLVEYANEMAGLGKLEEVLGHLARLDNVFVETEAGGNRSKGIGEGLAWGR